MNVEALKRYNVRMLNWLHHSHHSALKRDKAGWRSDGVMRWDDVAVLTF